MRLLSLSNLTIMSDAVATVQVTSRSLVRAAVRRLPSWVHTFSIVASHSKAHADTKLHFTEKH